MEKIYGNLRKPARLRRARAMQLFGAAHRYSTAATPGCYTYVLKINRSKCARGLDPLYGDARSAKSFKVLALIFITDCSHVDWLQCVLKMESFKNLFLSFLLFENQASRLGGGKFD